MECPRCKEQKVMAYIHVHMCIDADDNYSLTKKIIRKKSTEIISQSHDKTTYVCSKCGWAWGSIYNIFNNK